MLFYKMFQRISLCVHAGVNTAVVFSAQGLLCFFEGSNTSACITNYSSIYLIGIDHILWLWFTWHVADSIVFLYFCKLTDMERGASYLSVAIVDVSAGQDLCLVIKICQNNTLSIFNGKERIVFAVDKTNHTIIPVRIRKSKNAHDIYRLVVGHRASPLSFFGVVRFFSYSASFAFAHSGSLFVSATPRTSVMSHRHRSPEYNSSK